MASSTQAFGIIRNCDLLIKEMNGEIQEPGPDFKSVDFLPELLEPAGLFTSGTYEDFKTLIVRANQFLTINQKWKIVNCESVKFKSKHDHVNPDKMSYRKRGGKAISYVRGLRLWLVEAQEETQTKHKICHFNLIPQPLEKNGILDSTEFETLDEMLERFNSKQQLDPLPGRIINIESHKMKLSNFENFDPDRSIWTEKPNSLFYRKHFIFVLRIFYDLVEDGSEKIGVKDFVPDRIAKGTICVHPKYKKFADIVRKASAWCAEQSGMRICNVQTLEIKRKKGKEINTQRMIYSENRVFPTLFVRVLRVIYTQPFASCSSDSAKPSPIRELTYRTFVPEVTRLLSSKYENLVLTQNRISAWMKVTGAHIISAETLAYRSRLDADTTEGLKEGLTLNTSGTEYWIFVIRLYLDGAYQEPFPELLLPLPARVEGRSSLSSEHKHQHEKISFCYEVLKCCVMCFEIAQSCQ